MEKEYHDNILRNVPDIYLGTLIDLILVKYKLKLVVHFYSEEYKLIEMIKNDSDLLLYYLDNQYDDYTDVYAYHIQNIPFVEPLLNELKYVFNNKDYTKKHYMNIPSRIDGVLYEYPFMAVEKFIGYNELNKKSLAYMELLILSDYGEISLTTFVYHKNDYEYCLYHMNQKMLLYQPILSLLGYKIEIK